MKKRLILLTLLGSISTQAQASSWLDTIQDMALKSPSKIGTFYQNNKNPLIIGASFIGASVLVLKLFGKHKNLAETTPAFLGQRETFYTQISHEDLNTLAEKMQKYSSSNSPVATYVTNLSFDIQQLDKRYEAVEDKTVRQRIIKLKDTLISLKKALMNSSKYSDESERIKEDEELQNEREREERENYYRTRDEENNINTPSTSDTSNSNTSTSSDLSGSDYKECMDASQTFFGGPFGS